MKFSEFGYFSVQRSSVFGFVLLVSPSTYNRPEEDLDLEALVTLSLVVFLHLKIKLNSKYNSLDLQGYH